MFAHTITFIKDRLLKRKRISEYCRALVEYEVMLPSPNPYIAWYEARKWIKLNSLRERIGK